MGMYRALCDFPPPPATSCVCSRQIFLVLFHKRNRGLENLKPKLQSTSTIWFLGFLKSNLTLCFTCYFNPFLFIVIIRYVSFSRLALCLNWRVLKFNQKAPLLIMIDLNLSGAVSRSIHFLCLFLHLQNGLFSRKNWPLDNTGLNCAGPLICKYFSVNILETFLEDCDNLKNCLFRLGWSGKAF